MKVLNFDDIMNANDCKPVPVEVPEWGGHVFVKPMSGADRGRLELEYTNNKKSLEHLRAKIVTWCVVDEEGEQMFTADHVKDLSKKSAAALERIFKHVLDANMLGDDDIEDMTKN